MNNRTYTIPPLHKEMGEHVQAYINTLTKPPGSLGRLEPLAVSLAEMKNDPFPTVSPPGVLVFAADHGITAEGVSAFPQAVTEQMVRNFLSGGAAINVFSKNIGALLEIIDVGVAADIDHHDLIQNKVRPGTANFLREDAMSTQEAEEAIHAGYVQGEKIINKGAQCLIVGDMGIGNTTTSSTILALLANTDAKTVAGSGTGISEIQLQHKVKIIQQAIQARNPDRNDPLDILAKVGGLELAGMAGAMLVAAEKKTPILVDGFICTVAALLAKSMASHVSDYMILAHQSVEPGHDIASSMLDKQPLLDLELRLGEGTGAALAFPLLQSAASMVNEMATFTSAGISGKSNS
ncbi:nicotinate-nucleotide--dimethylbenzimidazole phosphoribosyltransferase [Salsuginibacillus kocurii]|uniref:nicotinate-nucleotide--dimethylbenzimidazole phosphoribosyltransferase n=1 Tax=Salsuginibacillus kocurii TaxID=427078 RepID=UPI00035E9DD6|nr:nicotinate-nucleotide--dimethylbenzimidazole phosphoribosyltransferase [Salsuginibacillus kocurii]